MIRIIMRGTPGWHLTLDLSSGPDLRATEFRPCVGLHGECAAYLKKIKGAWMAQSVKHRLLVSARVVISGSWDQALCWAPQSTWSLLGIPSASPAHALSLSNK